MCVPYVPVEQIDLERRHAWFTNTERNVRTGPGTTLLVIATDGSGVVDEFHVQAWVTHVQLRPGDPASIMFNHEGDGIGQQRIWWRSGGRIEPLRDSSGEPPEAAYWGCHEVWTRDGSGAAYHGGITIDGTERAFAGLVDVPSGDHHEILLPGPDAAWWNCHMTPNHDASVLVTDGTTAYPEGITLIHTDWAAGTLRQEPLCTHGTRWGDGDDFYQDVHPHPVFSHDDRWVVFTSDARNDLQRGHVYLVETGLGA